MKSKKLNNVQRIWLMRHGEAFDDVNNTFGGWADDKPTEKAMQDAEKTVKKLRELPIELIVSSPLKRAAIPAKLFADALHIQFEVSEDFKERNTYGFLTGMNKDAAKKKYPELVAKLSDLNFTIDGGEPFAHVRQRVLSGLKKVVKSGKNTLIVSHGGAIRTILSEFGQPRDANPEDFEIIEITDLTKKHAL